MSSVILLVDDNGIQATARQAVLEQSGRRVISVSGGQAALDFLARAEAAHRVGLIITDHLMPGMNGPELVEKVRQRGSGLPILVLSGLPDAESAYENLRITFRLKPCPPDSLISLVHDLMCDSMPRSA